MIAASLVISSVLGDCSYCCEVHHSAELSVCHCMSSIRMNIRPFVTLVHCGHTVLKTEKQSHK